MEKQKNRTHEVKEYFIQQLKKGKALSEKELCSYFKEIRFEGPLLQWIKNITELDFLPFFLEELEEIYNHGPQNIIYKTRSHKLPFESDITDYDFQIALEVLATKNFQDWNYSNPFTSFFSKIRGKKVRISLTHFSTSPEKKSKVFIRFLNESIIPLQSFAQTENDSKKLTSYIQEKHNILIAGATGSGKTTLLNSLMSKISEDEHPIILEDTFELLSPNRNTTRFLSDPKLEEKSLTSYMSYSMRLSPDRIILGEMRGKEVTPFLLAMNTGHNGLISTIHANSAKDALHRMALLFKVYSSEDLSYSLVLKLITANIDKIIFIKNKKIVEIINVLGSEKEQVFFERCA